ncbi:MAG: signal transduction histidine kinase [Paracoccaceae bacterium]|jgi:signal transduction histidine kinase
MQGALSLRARALLGGVVWIVLAVGLSGQVLLSTFDDISERAFMQKLYTQMEQMEALVQSGALENGISDAALSDPFFRRDGAGRYWQIQPPEGPPLLSASIGGHPFAPAKLSHDTFARLQANARLTAVDVPYQAYVTRMPDGLQVQALTGIVRRSSGDGTAAQPWVLHVGEARATLSRDQLEFRRSLFGALIGLGASLALAGVAQTGMALRPLVALRSAFVHYRSGQSPRIEGDYPSDIATLVDDLNELLDRNEEVIRRARRQAADLAHALKTPVAVISNDVAAPPRNDAEQAAQRARMRDALARIESLIARYTARARTAGPAAPGALCTPLPVVDGLGRVMAHVHRDAGLIFAVSIAPDLRVRVEEEDLEELLGNLIDNAHKWAVGVVRVRAVDLGGVVEITVEDDGPGIPEGARERALAAGGRLDEATPGTGLGLAICSDIIEAYGGTMALGVSELGGLAVSVRLPAPTVASTRRTRRG